MTGFAGLAFTTGSSGREGASGAASATAILSSSTNTGVSFAAFPLHAAKNASAATAIKYFFILYFLFRDLVTFGDITKDPLPFVFAEGLFNYLPPAGRWSSQYLAIVIRKCRVVRGRS